MSERKQEYYDDLTRQYESATSEREQSAIAKKIRDFEFMFPDFFSKEQELPLPAHQYSPLKNPFEYERSQLDPGMHTIRGKETMDGTRTRFAQGGDTNENDEIYDDMGAQMQLSGLVQEKTDIDPVSGNEIPLGATAEGVRDDKTAAISAGEFVIPDYAVRYHGVDFYMKSLSTAKQGLQQMDKMGMTGNPDDASMSDNTPLPNMNGDMEDKPLLDRPIDTEMFKGGFQSGGMFTAPVPTFASQPMTQVTQPLANPMGPYQVARPVTSQPLPPTYSATATPTTYTDYQGPGAGLPGGYGVKAYKNPKTGNTIYLTTIGGKLAPGTNVPAGFIPIEEANAQQAQPPAPTPPTTEIDRGGVTAFDLEMEAKKDEEERERELQARIDARKAAIQAALTGSRPGVPASVEDYIPAAVDPKHGMFIDGEFVRDANVLQKYQDSEHRSIYTENHPLGKAANALASFLLPGVKTVEVLKKIVDVFGKEILSPDKETATLIQNQIKRNAVEVEPTPSVSTAARPETDFIEGIDASEAAKDETLARADAEEARKKAQAQAEAEAATFGQVDRQLQDAVARKKRPSVSAGSIDPRLQAAVTQKKRKEAEDATYGKVDPQLQDAADIKRDEEEKELQREEARKVRGEKTFIQESPYGEGQLSPATEEVTRTGERIERDLRDIPEPSTASPSYEEALSAGGLVKKPIRKRTRKKKGKGLARSK
tara:strand:+ start:64 stop:2196 length:2133 start_codon:yes stop_codon:yes gene_type:complete